MNQINPGKVSDISPCSLGGVVVPKVTLVPLEDASGTGHVYSNTSLSNGSPAVTIDNTDQPDWAAGRELVVFQSDNAGDDLSVQYVIKFKTWDGRTVQHTFTLTATDSKVFSDPCVEIISVAPTIAGPGASDAIKIGYRGFYLPNVYLKAAADILGETVDGATPATAGTVPQNGFYLPDSVSSGNSISLWVKSRPGPSLYVAGSGGVQEFTS